MGLSEKLAKRQAAKEQKFAERNFNKIGNSGEKVVASFSDNKGPIDLDLLIKSTDIFDNDLNNEKLLLLLKSAKHKVMYEMVKDHLKEGWIDDFKAVVKQANPIQRKNAQLLSWDDWKELGIKASVSEEGVFEAVKVIAIFRKQISKANTKIKR